MPRKILVLALTALVAAALFWFATPDTDRGAVAPQHPAPPSASVALVDAVQPHEASEEPAGDSLETANATRATRERVAAPELATLEDRGFLLESAQPGVYAFALKPRRGVSSVYRVEGVVIAPGQPTRDSRLDPLDLRGTLHAWWLRFDGALREQTLSGSLRYGEAGSEERPLYQSVRSEELLLLSPFAVVDATLALNGFRPVELRGIQDDTVVQLEPGLPVRVVLTGQAALLEPPYGLSVALIPDEPGWHATDKDAAVFGEARELVVPCQEPGLRRVRWIVSRQRESSIPSLHKRTRTIDAEPLQVVEIQETLKEQRIEVLWTVQEADRLRALFEDD